MNKHLQDLIELSNIDKEIDSFDDRIERVKAPLNEILAKSDSLQKEMDDLKESVTDDKLKKSRNDLHLEELNSKLDSIASKGKDIKTDREMKALALEEEITKEQINFAIDEIERLEKTIELKESNQVQLSAKVEELKQKAKEEEETVSTVLETIDSEKVTTYANKDKSISTMDAKIITFYEKIKRWAKNTTVVPVKKQACYGCYMKINDKVYAEVIKSDEIVSCPHCGRILYYEPTPEAAEEA